MAATKGKLIVGQSGGTTPVINASLRGVIEQALHETNYWRFGHGEGVEGLLEGRLSTSPQKRQVPSPP